MKNIFLSVIAVLPFLASAQVEKGNIFLGGSVSLSSTSNTGTSTNSFTLSPRVGYFISNRSAIGGGIDIIHQKNINLLNTDKTGVAFFHRLYLPITESFFFVLHSEVGASFGKTSNVLGNADPEKISTIYVNTGPRFAFFATKHWQFEASVGMIGLTSTSRKPDVDNATKTTSTTFSLNAGSVGLGVFYYFRK